MYPGERFNSFSHLAGLVLALVGAVWLLARAMPSGDPLKLAGAAVFALSVIVLYAASTLYHSTRGPAKRVWERIDHGAIYLLIAGTVTPFALGPAGAPPEAWNIAGLCAIWGLAGIGIRHALRSPGEAAPPLWLYIGLGWMGVLMVLRGWAHLSATGLALLLGGAALYSIGTVFYRNRSGFRHAHGTWHVFVLGGTTSHYLAIGAFVL
ncbi:MAG: hemolysin III family protein [Comamonadaceae bacterium]|nr:MAG: hemolysin III family protein [Comamonadaceae bacterium]